MPVDSEAVREKLNALIEEKNIPVVTFNSDIVGTRRTCFVGMDNRKSGRTAAGLLGMLTRGIGKILIITGYFSNHVDNQRVDGFVEEVKRAFPHLEIAGVHGSFDEAAEVEHIIENAMMNTSGISGILVVSGGQEGVGKAFEKLRLDRRLVDKDGAITVGAPTVEGAKVVVEVVNPLVKGDKVIVFKMKRRKDYRKKNGHRAQFTEVSIKSVIA